MPTQDNLRTQLARLTEDKDTLEHTLRDTTSWYKAELAELTGDGPCQECGGQNMVWYAPNDLWNLVMGGPGAKDDPGGILCPTCFCRRVGVVTVNAEPPAAPHPR